jgi:hypothetical protein
MAAYALISVAISILIIKSSNGTVFSIPFKVVIASETSFFKSGF